MTDDTKVREVARSYIIGARDMREQIVKALVLANEDRIADWVRDMRLDDYA